MYHNACEHFKLTCLFIVCLLSNSPSLFKLVVLFDGTATYMYDYVVVHMMELVTMCNAA